MIGPGRAGGLWREVFRQGGKLCRREPWKNVLLEHRRGDEEDVHVAQRAQAVAERPEFSLPARDELAQAKGFALAEVAFGALAVVVAAAHPGEAAAHQQQSVGVVPFPRDQRLLFQPLALADSDDAWLPSVVAFPPTGTTLVGAAARRRRAIDPKNTLGSTKRVIGRGPFSESVPRFREFFPCALVATDAGESAQRLAAWAADWSHAEGRGVGRGVKVVSYGTKSEIGRVFGRAEVALLAITDARIAAELATTIERLSGLEDRA